MQFRYVTALPFYIGVIGRLLLVHLSSLFRLVVEAGGGEVRARDEVQDLTAFRPTHALLERHPAWSLQVGNVS